MKKFPFSYWTRGYYQSNTGLNITSPIGLFYLKPFIPYMTSNSSPYGTGFANENNGSAYQAFQSGNNYWSDNDSPPSWVGYSGTYNIVPVQSYVNCTMGNPAYGNNISIQGQNGVHGSWNTLTSFSIEANINQYITLSNGGNSYSAYRLFLNNDAAGGYNYVYMFQIYGY